MAATPTIFITGVVTNVAMTIISGTNTYTYDWNTSTPTLAAGDYSVTVSGTDTIGNAYAGTDSITFTISPTFYLDTNGVKIKCIQANPAEVLGANNKHELHELELILRKMSAKKLLEQGITLIDKTRGDVRGKVVAGKDCSIDVNVILEGDVTFGNNVIIKSVSYTHLTLPTSYLV